MMDGVTEGMVVGVRISAVALGSLSKFNTSRVLGRAHPRYSGFDLQVTTEAIAGEGMIITAGGCDMHVSQLQL